MDKWFANQRDFYTFNRCATQIYKSFSMSVRRKTKHDHCGSCDHLIENAFNERILAENKQNFQKIDESTKENKIPKNSYQENVRVLKKTFSMKSMKRKNSCAVDKRQPVFAPVLKTYNPSLFKDNPQWL